jgi:hypothetical protein
MQLHLVEELLLEPGSVEQPKQMDELEQAATGPAF